MDYIRTHSCLPVRCDLFKVQVACSMDSSRGCKLAVAQMAVRHVMRMKSWEDEDVTKKGTR
jgi:hypothetical protein